jgi:hypothetical protein
MLTQSEEIVKLLEAKSEEIVKLLEAKSEEIVKLLEAKSEEIVKLSEAKSEEIVKLSEAELKKLKQTRVNDSAPQPWWEKITGTFSDNPDYDEAMKLGREYRESLRSENEPLDE